MEEEARPATGLEPDMLDVASRVTEDGPAPAVTVDPGPNEVVVIVRRGQPFTFLRGGRDGEPVEKSARPKIKIPTPVGPPITAQFVAMSVAETAEADESIVEQMTATDLGEAARVELATEFPLAWEEISVETREIDAMSTGNDRTLLIRVPETNAVVLDRFEDTLMLAARIGASVLVKFV